MKQISNLKILVLAMLFVSAFSYFPLTSSAQVLPNRGGTAYVPGTPVSHVVAGTPGSIGRTFSISDGSLIQQAPGTYTFTPNSGSYAGQPLQVSSFGVGPNPAQLSILPDQVSCQEGSCAVNNVPLSDAKKTDADRTARTTVCSGVNYIYNLATCVSYDFLTLFAWILGIAGLLLNAVIDFTVINGGTNLNIDAIRSVWITIRDLANIVLIFSLLLIGISTILRVQAYGAKKWLVGVIAAALLINFSFAATRVVIDASNYISYQFYQGLIKGDTTDRLLDSKVGISGKFMQAVGLGSIYNDTYSGNPVAAQSLAATLSGGRSFLIHMLGIILFIILTFSFLIAALHLVARFVTFLVLIATSPLAVIALFLPFYRGFWNRWWEALWSNAIMAPAYFLLLFFILQILTVFQSRLGSSGSFASFATEQGPASGINILVNFAIVIALAIISLTAARKIGSEGVHAINLTTRAVGRYGGGFLARNTIGRPAAAISERWSKAPGWLGGGYVLGNTLRKYTAGAVAGTKFGGEKSGAKVREEIKKEKSERQGVRQFADDRATLEKNIDTLETVAKQRRANPSYKMTTEEEEASKNARASWDRMSNAQREEMGHEFLSKAAVSGLMNADQLAVFTDVKNEHFSNTEKNEMRRAYFHDLVNALEHGTQDQIDRAARLYSSKEIEQMNPELRTHSKLIRTLIKQNKYKDILDSRAISREEKAQHRAQREKYIHDEINAHTIGTLIRESNAEAVASLAGMKDPSGTQEVLLHPEVLPQITKSIARAIGKSSANDTIRRGIKAHVSTAAAGTPNFGAREYMGTPEGMTEF